MQPWRRKILRLYMEDELSINALFSSNLTLIMLSEVISGWGSGSGGVVARGLFHGRQCIGHTRRGTRGNGSCG